MRRKRSPAVSLCGAARLVFCRERSGMGTSQTVDISGARDELKFSGLPILE
jgi:hypothetical protein